MVRGIDRWGVALKLCKATETTSVHDEWLGVKGCYLHVKWKRLEGTCSMVNVHVGLIAVNVGVRVV